MTFNISSDSKSENNYILQKRKQDQSRVSFKGIESVANYVCSQVQTGEFIGPTAVDLVAMVAPRTIIDSSRNKDAGRETLIRETSGNIINCIIPGFVAAGVGWLLGKFIKPELKINTALPVDSDTLEMLHHSWKESNGNKFWEEGADKKQVVKGYAKNVLNKVEGLVGEKWIKLSDIPGAVEKLADKAADLNINEKNLSKKEIKKGLEELKKQTIDILGASESIKVNKTLGTTVDKLINGMHDVCREIHTKITPDKIDSAIEKATTTNKKKSVIAIGIIAGLGLAQQAVNRYMTKKRTGSDAFVGLSEESKKAEESENSGKTSKTKLYMAKALSVGAILGIAAATIANSIKPKEILKALKGQNLVKKLEFNSMWPSCNQLRSVYAAMIAGRMLASTDKHELRETNTRDIPGFLNWLVLGGFVSKYVGKKISDGKIINSSTPLEKNASKWTKIMHFFGSESLNSHAEIDARKMTIEEAKEILSKSRKKIIETDAEKIIFKAKKLLKWKLSKSIFAGLAYSTLALGLFMPMLNKHITNKLTAKNKAKDKPNTDSTVAILLNPLNNNIFADFIKTQQKLKKV